MTSEQVEVGRTRVLRPHTRLFTHGLIGVVALTTPVFAVLYWLSIPDGRWPAVLFVHLVVLALTALCVAGYLGTSIRVDTEGVRERGFFGVTRWAPRDRIACVLLIEIYRDSMLETEPNLFVCDDTGRCLVRMRGQFWPREALDALPDALGIPLTVADTAVTFAELRRSRPELLYWFERMNVLA